MTWRARHPSAIPRADWIARLDAIPNASPYLLPEWSQFWTDVWPRSQAEVYDDGVTLIPVVSRIRLGMGQRYAQPYGTDCLIGDSANVQWPELVTTMCRDRAVEVAISADLMESPRGWERRSLSQGCWIIDTAGKTFAELARTFSDSHIRNITRGARLELRIDDTPDPDILIRIWRDRERAPRFMLNPVYARALINRFAPVDALVWRTAWAGERPVAGSIFLIHKNSAVSVDPIVDRDPRFRGAGHALTADTLKKLINSGVTHIDLGGSPGGGEHPGLGQFKSGWGSAQKIIHTTLYRRRWYSLIRRW